MVTRGGRFIASAPGGQHPETVRQFQAIERELQRMREQLDSVLGMAAATETPEAPES